MNEFFEKLICPISKQKLVSGDDNNLIAPCGFLYKGLDFRVGLDFSKEWEKGQKKYEQFETNWIVNLNSEERLKRIDVEAIDIYEQLDLGGDFLDVGGSYGSVILQAKLDPAKYYSIDPNYMNWDKFKQYEQFYSHYKVCENVKRVIGFAEFLPFADESFTVVHMRSCLDHFSNPALALKEAFRVLRPNGKLIVGLSLVGAYKRDEVFWKRAIKSWKEKSDVFNKLIEFITADPHMFHPTEVFLKTLITKNGFEIKRIIKQKEYYNVVYIEAIRAERLPINQ